ncbi:hypothetical protein H7K28_12750 [Paenibacillus polymyxa]|jgi:hypothetical protein|uniref:hypothetical protein n=1 Tax=Paenibacillus TaxID=44249 RepID=UPI000D315A16|nr:MULTISPECIES: hypothetical protein [Paenibacillus]KAF6616198.1 hypothetical protein HFE00_16895 [Paenibacillus sp. EKM101P]KAF6618241.1 hypothetical protein HFE03_22365 [Paenibacillus sp. EKM102P]KAF6626474.1 hypothetical protein HFE01_21975 [Paenibacillus sp. EKM10P]KAF6642948.1 hypothetical protein HFE02_22360 [Paenibacillus sp. EKM11P]MBY0020939.1 hypothetical protein [Paenibacillus polymyxa]
MKKLKIIVPSLIVIIALGFIIVSSIHGLTDTNLAKKQPSSDQKYKIAVSKAHMPYFEDVEALEKQSTAIVIGHVTGEQQPVEIKADSGTVIDRRAFVPFTIDKTFKGDYSEGKQITVSEDGLIHNGTYESLEGYVKMNNTDPYLLFLQEVEPSKFKIVGSYQGKFNTKPTNTFKTQSTEISSLELEKTDFVGDPVESEHFEKLKNSALSKFSE